MWNFKVHFVNQVISLLNQYNQLELLFAAAQPTASVSLEDNQVILTYASPGIDSSVSADMVNCSRILVGPVPMDITMALPLTGPAIVDTTIMDNTVTCRMSVQLQIAIKTSPNFGTSTMDTIVYMQAGHGIVDASMMEYSNMTGFMATSVISTDNEGPELMSFVEFDLDQGIISFSFNEVVNISSLNFTDLTLQNNFVSSSESVTLTGGECNTTISCVTSDMFSIAILDADLNRIKLQRGLCTSSTDCVPTYTGAFVTDLNGNAVRAYDQSRQAQHQLIRFIDDTTSPQLQAFDLNLSSDQLVLAFSEPVDVSSFTPESFTLQSTFAGGEGTVVLTSESVPPSADSETITITLRGDADALKLASFATSMNDTFISVRVGGIDDLYGNDLQIINSTNAQQVRMYTNDITPPDIASVTLDLDTNRLVITFTEPVLASSLVVTNFSLTNGTTENILSLDDSTLVDSTGMALGEAATVIAFMLGDATLTSIKTDDTIGTSAANTFLEWQANSFEDTSNNTNATAASISVNNFVSDDSPATLEAFSLDLNIGELILTFTDVVDVASARLDRRTVSLQDRMNANGFYDITGGIITSTDSNIVTVQLNMVDTLAVKALLDVATSTLNTFITIEAEAFQDLRSVPIIAVTDRNAISVTLYIGDSTPPMLQSFDFDLNQGHVIMTYNEPVDNGTFVFDRLAIQDGASNNSNSIVLQGGTTTATNFFTVVTLMLERSDLNAIKANTDIATEAANTFLMLQPGAVNDTSTNPVMGTDNGTVVAIPVTVFTPDITPPTITSFILDLNDGVIRITFDETINITTFVDTFIILQSSSTTGGIELQLSGGMSTTAFSPVVNVTLLVSDLNFIKLTSNFGDNRDTTYLRNLAGVTVDQSGQVARAGGPIRASRVITDTTEPDLQRFSFDQSQDLLSLTFDEPVNASTLDIMQFTLYRTASRLGGVMLMGSVNSSNGVVIDIILDSTLAFSIKNDPTLANDVRDTFIDYNMGAVRDVANVPISARSTPLQASIVLSDTSGPLIDAFNFDLDQGLLTLLFPEPVNPASFNGRFVTIQDSPSSSNRLTLTGGNAVETAGNSTLNIVLLDQDLNAIKANTDLATSLNDTFLVLDSAALMDTFGNPVSPVVSASALQVAIFTPDTTPPNVTTFELRNAPNGFDLILVVVFSETVNASTVIPVSFTLFEAPGSPNNYTLTSGNVTLVNSYLPNNNSSARGL